jgi:methyl-accepting chemotaxis protein
MDRVVQQNEASAEESAGASQELTTQSRQMKLMVDELHLLVSGNSSYRLTEGNGGHMRIAAEEDHGSTPLKTLPAPSLAAGQSLKPGPPLADKSPEQIIPLEGDNF